MVEAMQQTANDNLIISSDAIIRGYSKASRAWTLARFHNHGNRNPLAPQRQGAFLLLASKKIGLLTDPKPAEALWAFPARWSFIFGPKRRSKSPQSWYSRSVSLRPRHRWKLFTHTQRLFTHAAQPLSYTGTAEPLTRPKQVTMHRGWVFISPLTECGNMTHLCPLVCVSSRPRSVPELPSHLPLSISVPPGRLVRDGAVPATPAPAAAVAAGHSGTLHTQRG